MTTRFVLGIGLAACIALQVVVLPWMSGWVAHDNPEVASLRWPVLTLSILGLLCVDVILMCIWRLLSAVAASRIFDPRVFGWVDGIVWALAAAAAVSLVALVYLLKAGVGPLTVPVSALFASLVALGMMSLTVVMRTLLHQATALRTEMDAVI